MSVETSNYSGYLTLHSKSPSVRNISKRSSSRTSLGLAKVVFHKSHNLSSKSGSSNEKTYAHRFMRSITQFTDHKYSKAKKKLKSTQNKKSEKFSMNKSMHYKKINKGEISIKNKVRPKNIQIEYNYSQGDDSIDPVTPILVANSDSDYSVKLQPQTEK